MQNKVVAVYRNDEVAHAAVNELLEDGFTLDQIYISSEDDAGQVEKYDRIGESNLLVDLKGDLGDFYRSIIGVDGILEKTGFYTKALKEGHVVVSVDTDSYEKAREAAKTMNHFETLGTSDISAFPEPGFNKSKENDAFDVVGTGVLIFKHDQSQGNQMDMNDTRNSSSDFTKKVSQATENVKNSVASATDKTTNSIKSAADKTKETVKDAADATSSAMEKAVDKTSEVLKKAGDSVKEMFGKDDSEEKHDETTRSASSAGDNFSEVAFKNHWRIRYLSSGGEYNDCEPAYQYGAQLAENEKKHLNRPWEQVEPSAHAAWELYNRDSEQSWEKNRDAIKFGWDYVMEGHKPGKSFF